jgi:glucose/arabinose dehydrogenase
MALHPDFTNPANAYIYYVYSYNQGTVQAPETRFKVKRLLWDASIQSVVNDVDLILNITTGYDHLGGRLMAIRQNGNDYLFLSVGDHGISEANSPTCYNPQSTNQIILRRIPQRKTAKFIGSILMVPFHLIILYRGIPFIPEDIAILKD